MALPTPPKHVVLSVFHSLFQILQRVYETLVRVICGRMKSRAILTDTQEQSRSAATIQRCLKHCETKPEASYCLLHSIILKLLLTLLTMVLETRKNCGITSLWGPLNHCFSSSMQAALLQLWPRVFVTHGQCYRKTAAMSAQGYWDSRPQV